MHKEITFVILIFEEDTSIISQCLEKIKNFNIIIVDNSGNLSRKKKLEEKFKIAKYLLNEKNFGFAKGNNRGIKLCETEYIFVMNPDCMISEENVLKLLSSHKNYKNCFIATPTFLDENDKISYNSGTFPEKELGPSMLESEGDVCVDTVLASAILFKKRDMMEIGLFDENFFIWFEDFDLCRRIRERKKSTIQIFEAKAYHVHGQRKSIKNPLKKTFIENYNMTFGELYYFFKIKQHDEKYKKIKKKLLNFIVKSVINLLLIRFNRSIYYFSKVVAFFKFKKILNKNK